MPCEMSARNRQNATPFRNQLVDGKG